MEETPKPSPTELIQTDSSIENTNKRRRTRWAPHEEGRTTKRKSRWSDEDPSIILEIHVLVSRLQQINTILQSNSQFRSRKYLIKERNDIIMKISQKDPNYKIDVDYKLQKKLFIPVKEYPGYNFIGLIIGPRGNTQKRMEKETGAKILIRGNGSTKEGKKDLGEDEDLHVLVKADTKEALDAAAGMVEKMLKPVEEGFNEHKREQLKELAKLNGTLKEGGFCKFCGQGGHRGYVCPEKPSSFESKVLCRDSGDGGHPMIDCNVNGISGKKMDDVIAKFMVELGGIVPEGVFKLSGSNNGGFGPSAHHGLGSFVAKTEKEIDDTNLFIGNLPFTFDDDALIQLFSPFGSIVTAKVIKDREKGLNKGYGFVKYSDITQANQAISSMNGYQLDGRTIVVRLAGKPREPAQPPPALAPFAYMNPDYQGSNSSHSGCSMQNGTPGGVPPGGFMSSPPPCGSQAPPHAPYGAREPLVPPEDNYGTHPQYLPPGETGPSVVQSPTTESNPAAIHIYPGVVTLNSQQRYYPSSYYAPPSPPHGVTSVMEQQNYSSAPWISKLGAPPCLPPSWQQPRRNTYGADSEYEKLS